MAEIEYGSPRPSFQNSAARYSLAWSSILLTASTTGLAGGTQHLDDALIGGGHAHLTIDNEYHSIGQGHGNLCL